MILSKFIARPDLRGRRIWLMWRFDFSSGEALGALPAMRLARKTLDYEFPQPPANPDPFVIYDSTNFPSTGATAATLQSRDAAADGGRVATEIDSVSINNSEVLRRTICIRTDGSGNPLSWTMELLDAGSLDPLTTYYYELRLDVRPNLTIAADTRACATTTERYELGAKMYSMLPEMFRRHDVVTAQPPPTWNALPESDSSSGQLSRFLDLMGSAADYTRSRAEGMLDIHDFRNVNARLLPLFAQWIGWDLSFDLSIPLQRHEIRYAADLYRITGTIPGCMIWSRRLTSWPTRVKEFYRNVFFTNDVGDKNDPLAKGSTTVDTSKAATLAAIGTFDDTVQYTYDTGTSETDWYAYNVVGLFVRPSVGETVESVNRKLAKLHASFELFLPVNIRGVVVVETDSQSDSTTGSGNLLHKVGDSVT